MNILKREKQCMVIRLLTEGCSIRAISRITSIHQDTTSRLLVRVGDHCAQIHDERIQNLKCVSVQADELWCFIAKKQRRVTPDDPWEHGDAYTFVAMDTHSKLVVSYLTGKRDEAHTRAFIDDLSQRLSGRTQLSTDGYRPYETIVRSVFNGRVDYAMVVKSYEGGSTDDEHRYSPPQVVSTNRKWICGLPKHHLITTSHVERQNLTCRMQMRRFTRLTNAFSRKMVNLRAAVALHFTWYNFVRIHRSLGMTPAMAHRVTHRLWKIEELLPRSN